MSEAQIQNIGTLVEKYLTEDGTENGVPLTNKNTGEPILDAEGNAVRVLELKLKQNVDILVGGAQVNFRPYTLKNGTELKSKVLSLTSAETELKYLNERVENGKVQEDIANSIKESYERDNVLYTVKVSKNNQA